MCISGDKRDFISELESVDAMVKGIASGLEIKRKGRVKWSVLDQNGKLLDLILPAYYVPNACQRLLSTTVFCQEYPDANIAIDGNAWIIHPNNTDNKDKGVDVYINPLNNLPTSTCF